MANYPRPVTINAGQIEQIPSGAGLDIGAYQLPEVVGIKGQHLVTPASGTILEWVEVIGTITKLRVYNSSITQTLSGTTPVKIIFPSKEYDTLGEFDTTLSRFTVTKSGLFLIVATVGSSRSSVATLNVYFYKNGSLMTSYFVNANYPHIHLSDVRYLNSGDYVELWGASGASVTNPLLLGMDRLYLTVIKLL